MALQDNIDGIDIEKFIRYLMKFPVISVRKRAGFLLEKLGCRNKALEPLRKSIGEKRVLVLLDPYSRSRKGKINKEWKSLLIDREKLKDIIPAIAGKMRLVVVNVVFFVGFILFLLVGNAVGNEELSI